jgi:hypothetical protein
MFKWATTSMILGALALMWPDLAYAGGKFSLTCSNISLNGIELQAKCRRDNGSDTQTRIDIDYLIANVDGTLTWSPPQGRFLASSKNCAANYTYKPSGPITILSCDTAKRNGSWTNSNLNLDDRIANINGTLTYQP